MSTFRRLLPLEREYRVRSVVGRPSFRPNQPPIIHVASWKTASQWVRMVITDPQLMHRTGYIPSYVRGRTGAPGLTAEMCQPSRVLTPVYANADEPNIDGALREQGARVFVVVRDPFGLARSWYRANLSGHPSNADVDRRRRELQPLLDGNRPARDVLRATLGLGFDETLRIGASWIERSRSDSSIAIVRFEDLTGPDPEPSLTFLLGHVGASAHLDLVPVLLHRYHKHRIGRLERLLRPAAERKYAPESTTPADGTELSDTEVRQELEDLAPADLLEPFNELYPHPLVDEPPASLRTGTP